MIDSCTVQVSPDKYGAGADQVMLRVSCGPDPLMTGVV